MLGIFLFPGLALGAASAGVTSVSNDLNVATTTRTSAQIARDVTASLDLDGDVDEELRSSPFVRGEQVHASAQGDHVTLTGRMDTFAAYTVTGTGPA